MTLPPQLLARHVFVDLETTGLDPAVDEVIELGALFIEGGVVTRRLSRLFRPSRPLPLAIRRLTGLCDEDLAGEPDFGSVRAALAKELAGYTLVAHNAGFEQSFLKDVLGESTPLLDTCELLHYLHPELPSHSLESTVRWANVAPKASHRALKDCEDTHAVVCHALEGVLSEHRGDDVRALLDCLWPSWSRELEGAPPIVELLVGLERACGPLSSGPDAGVFPPAARPRLRKGPPPPSRKESPLPVGEDEVAQVLGPGGLLELSVPGFSPRASQVQLGVAVANAFSSGTRLAAEAGTGTGKSLAYLTPAALFAKKNGVRVGIAPHTKTLQDQLVEKDLPKLHRALGGSFGYAVLKGQNNYLCRRRTLELCRVDPSHAYSERAARAYLRVFLERSPDGDLDRVSHWFKERHPALLGLLRACRSEAATTLGEACPHFSRCYFHAAVAQAKRADLVVVNHSLAAAWPNRYPELSHLVLDEAHELEDVLTQAASVELEPGALGRAAERLVGPQGRGGLIVQLRRHAQGARRAVLFDLCKALEAGVQAMGELTLGLEDAVSGVCEAQGDGSAAELRLTSDVLESESWRPAEAALGELAKTLVELERQLGPLLKAAWPDLAVDQPSLERELSGAAAEIGELRERTQAFLGPPDPSCCNVASFGRHGFSLLSTPIDVRRAFEERLGLSHQAVVLTSATLSARAKDDWVLSRLGLLDDDKPKLARVHAQSPFELQRQALVILITDAPDPQTARFVEWSSERICGLARFMGGRVLGLFSSVRRLDEVAARVEQKLLPEGIEVLRQSRGQTRSLVGRQEQDLGTVLLGTKSLWQGVDIVGRGVGLVFIDKLPLEPRQRPIVAAREEQLEEAAQNGFVHYRLPKALLLLRQGVGRLVRSTHDRGVVLIADPGNPTYRAEVVQALSEHRVEVLTWERARRRIFDALVAMDLRAPASRPAPQSGEAAERAPA